MKISGTHLPKQAAVLGVEHSGSWSLTLLLPRAERGCLAGETGLVVSGTGESRVWEQLLMVIWVAGQEWPMPRSRQVWVPLLPDPRAGSLLMGLRGYKQLSSGCFFSAFFFPVQFLALKDML